MDRLEQEIDRVALETGFAGVVRVDRGDEVDLAKAYGLAHRGWKLFDYGHHIVHTLRKAGYHSELIGEQHISEDPNILGYDRVHEIARTNVETAAPVAVEFLRNNPPEPFFLSVGFFETHRDFQAPTSVRDTLYSQPPPNLPDTLATREDIAAFKASARSLDQGIGSVLNELHRLVFTFNRRDHGRLRQLIDFLNDLA